MWTLWATKTKQKHWSGKICTLVQYWNACYVDNKPLFDPGIFNILWSLLQLKLYSNQQCVLVSARRLWTCHTVLSFSSFPWCLVHSKCTMGETSILYTIWRIGSLKYILCSSLDHGFCFLTLRYHQDDAGLLIRTFDSFYSRHPAPIIYPTNESYHFHRLWSMSQNWLWYTIIKISHN